MSKAIWTTLGIARTHDETAIRRAYSARLKTIDVDADPAAFMALRDAFAAARAYARRSVAQTEPVLANAAASDDRPGAGDAAEPSAAPPDPTPAKPDWVEDIEAIQQIVYGSAPREATFDEVQARTAHLLDGPAMEAIDHAANVERWTAETILSGMPRTNAMLQPAIERFGWIDRTRQWNCPPAILHVVQRYADCHFIGSLADGDDVKRAFEMLRDPLQPPGARFAPQIERMLQIAATSHPTLQHDFDRDAVAAWTAFLDHRRGQWSYRLKAGAVSKVDAIRRIFSQRGRWRGWLAIVVALNLLRLVVSWHDPSPNPGVPIAVSPTAPAPQLLANKERDIDVAVRESLVGNFGIDDVERNPTLYEALGTLWKNDQSARATQAKFTSDVRDLFERRYNRALPNLSYALAVQRQKLRLEQARAFATRDPAACADLMEGAAVDRIPPAMVERMRELDSRVLLETRKLGPASDGERRIAIPAAIGRDARARSGLGESVFHDALLGKGTPEQRCRTRISVMDAALAAPEKTALSLLRTL